VSTSRLLSPHRLRSSQTPLGISRPRFGRSRAEMVRGAVAGAILTALLGLALVAFAGCSAEPEPETATAASAFTCVRRGFSGSCSIWWPGLIPASPTQPIAPTSCWDATMPADGYVKVFTGQSFGGLCNLLAPGTYGTLGDWHHAADTGDGIPEVRVRSMILGSRVSVAVYSDPGFSGLLDFWTFALQIPDMFEQRAGSIATWWQP